MAPGSSDWVGPGIVDEHAEFGVPGQTAQDSCPPWLHWHSIAHRGGISCTDGGCTPGSPVTVSYPCLSLSLSLSNFEPGKPGLVQILLIVYDSFELHLFELPVCLPTPLNTFRTSTLVTSAFRNPFF